MLKTALFWQKKESLRTPKLHQYHGDDFRTTYIDATCVLNLAHPIGFASMTSEPDLLDSSVQPPVYTPEVLL